MLKKIWLFIQEACSIFFAIFNPLKILYNIEVIKMRNPDMSSKTNMDTQLKETFISRMMKRVNRNLTKVNLSEIFMNYLITKKTLKDRLL
jgi:hypothetical protein